MGLGFKFSWLFWACVGSIVDTYDIDLEERWRSQEVLSDGLCRYGNRVECCWGWRPVNWGRCQPYCHQECKHGQCIGPDRCQCYHGYTGKTCNQDLNECGLKPRPCKHRCMNTHGSFKCYCLHGYTMQPDGSCKNARTCALANCQYGCEVTKGEVRCKCPSAGLRLGPDRRTCVDINECVSGGAVCPRRRKCVNTFGSYLCKCHQGFKLRYLNGRYNCIVPVQGRTLQRRPQSDSGTSMAQRNYNTHHQTNQQPFHSASQQTHAQEDQHSPTDNHDNHYHRDQQPHICPHDNHYHGNNCLCHDCHSTTTTITTTTVAVTTVPTTTLDNRIQKEENKQRGDVHIPRQPDHNQVWEFDIELGNTAEDDFGDDPDTGLVHCSFDHGVCGWISDKEGDLQWQTVHHNAAD
ncbi:nephronectin-like [Aplochiton taeniatus]